jgi:hypothetical protein
VFDPLAITLVIATNQAFKGKRKDEVTIHDTIHDTIQVTPQVTDQVNPIVIEKIDETPVYVEKQEPIIKREKLKLVEEPTWNRTSEERNDEVVNENIKRLIYKK